MGWPTAQTVVTQAALELGLIGRASELGDDVYESVDPTVAQLLALLKKAGRDLVDEFLWAQLRAEWSITTVMGGDFSPAQRVGSYVLPPDWRELTAQSGWNRTSRLPMGGPLSEQEWQYLSAGITGVVWTVLFRPMQGLLWLYPSTETPEGQEITFAYKSSYWVRPASLIEGTDYGAWLEDNDYLVGAMVASVQTAGNPFERLIYRCVQPGLSGANGPDPARATTGVPTITGSILDGEAYWNYVGSIATTTNPLGTENTYTPSFATRDVPITGTDVLLFDEALLVAKLKLLWKREKGFDTMDTEREFARIFAAVTSNSSPAPILNLNGTAITSDRFLGGLNIPITGFGS